MSRRYSIHPSVAPEVEVSEGITYLRVPSTPALAVSNCGRVRSRMGRLLAQRLDNTGYLIVAAPSEAGRSRKRYVHRLVAEVFLKTAADGASEINHKDGNKAHPHHLNLEWVTHQQNLKHAASMGLISNLPQKGQKGFQYVTS